MRAVTTGIHSATNGALGVANSALAMRGRRPCRLREAQFGGARCAASRPGAAQRRSPASASARECSIRQRGGLPSVRLRAQAACQEEQGTAAQRSTAPPADPFADPVEYEDSAFGKLLIAYFTKKISEEVGTPRLACVPSCGIPCTKCTRGAQRPARFNAPAEA